MNWDWLPGMGEWTVTQALDIQRIPAPTFSEVQRAEYIKGQFQALGLVETTVDSLHNVYGLLPGENRAVPGLMISAHTDTVFSSETNLDTRAQNGLIYGPGLGDNSMGVAGMLALALILKNQRITPACDLWFVATSCEEGLGDLKGMKAAFERLKSRIQSVINLEGLALGHVYHAGTAVRRLRITISAEGGHSWLHFGRPSAIHGLMELGARIAGIRPSQSPRTTYNIGLVEGGHSINSIATKASLWLDLRSETQQALETLEQLVQAHIDAVARPDMPIHVEIVGDRPAGHLEPNHPLIEGAITALERLSVQAALETASTDGNIPLAAGYPAVTIGITRGGNAHRLDEFIETAPVETGLRQLVMLALAAADYQTQQSKALP